MNEDVFQDMRRDVYGALHRITSRGASWAVARIVHRDVYGTIDEAVAERRLLVETTPHNGLEFYLGVVA